MRYVSWYGLVRVQGCFELLTILSTEMATKRLNAGRVYAHVSE